MLEKCSNDTAPNRVEEEDDISSWFDWNGAMMDYASGLVISLSIDHGFLPKEDLNGS